MASAAVLVVKAGVRSTSWLGTAEKLGIAKMLAAAGHLAIPVARISWWPRLPHEIPHCHPPHRLEARSVDLSAPLRFEPRDHTIRT
jgi:hypothetical protein